MKFILIILLAFPVSLMTEKRIDGLYYEANSADPSTYEFNANELVVQTDSILHFGFQYTSYYEVKNINDSIFELHFKKQYSQNNNNPSNLKRKRKKVKGGRSFWFDIDKFKFWSFRENGEGIFKLNGYELTEDKFQKKIGISLVTTKPKLH